MLNSKNLRLKILMVLAMLSWGLSWTNAKLLGQYSDAPLIMVWRFFFASISIIPVLIISKISFYFKKGDSYLILLNALFMVLYNYFYFMGTQIGLAGAGGVLVTTLNPILTSIFLVLFFNNKIFKKDYFGFLLGLLGGALIIRVWDFSLDNLIMSGNLYFLLASVSWVFVTIITAKSKNRISFIAYSFWSYTFAFFLCIPISYKENLFSVFQYGWIFWLNLILLSVVAMSFGTSIYFLASTKLGPKKSSSFIFLVPLTAIFFAIIFLSEPLQFSTLIGGALGITSVYLLNKS